MDLLDLYDYTVPMRVTEYANYALTVKNLSPETVSNYKHDLKVLLKFLKKIKTRSSEPIEDINISDIDDVFLKEITLNDLYMFFNYVTMQRKNGVAARARKTACIKSFFKYLETKAKILNHNPATELESPKLEKRNPIYLTLDESKKLLATISGVEKERNYCIVTIFLNCGLRLSELVGINRSNIKGDIMTVIGKGNKERTIYLTDACVDAISDYLEVRKESIDDDDALFTSNRRKRISNRAVQKLLKKYFVESGLVGKKYTAHKLRHTAATLLYKYGQVDIRALQQILGHESISTTQIYTHVDEEQLRAAVKTNPLADVKK